MAIAYHVNVCYHSHELLFMEDLLMIYFIYNREVSIKEFYDFVANNKCIIEDGELDNDLYLNVKSEELCIMKKR